MNERKKISTWSAKNKIQIYLPSVIARKVCHRDGHVFLDTQQSQTWSHQYRHFLCIHVSFYGLVSQQSQGTLFILYMFHPFTAFPWLSQLVLVAGSACNTSFPLPLSQSTAWQGDILTQHPFLQGFQADMIMRSCWIDHMYSVELSPN